MTIHYKPRFLRGFHKLDTQLGKLAKERILQFQNDPFDPRLDTHHLHGKLKKQWSFSVDRRYRILFEFLNKKKQEVVFLDIGNHSLYQ